MPTPLAAPFNVATTKTNDNTIKVTWDDRNDSAKVSKRDISFLKKDTLAPFVPKTVGGISTGETKDGVTPCSVEITRDGTAPTAADLASLYIARVVDKPAAADTDNSDSEPGLQIYWDANLSLTVQVGSHTFTLTKGSAPGGIYRLPVSRENPFRITLSDVQEFADAVGVGRDKVPTRWPDGSEITGSLNLYKLAVDTERKLAALDIAFELNFSPVPGLRVQEVGLSVVRTDGAHVL